MEKRILLVDDDPLVIKSVRKYLEASGYLVEAVQSGNEALEKAEKADFDLIISDVRMPGIDGVETLKRIKKLSLKHKKKEVPVIVVTGYVGKDEIFQKAEELGIVDCIYKPFELKNFSEAVKKNLEFPPQYQKEITIDYGTLDKRFISLVQDFKRFLKETGEKLDEFDNENKERTRRIQFLESEKKEIFKKTNYYMENIWSLVKGLSVDDYNSYTHYLRKEVNQLFIHSAEINDYIFKKPSGYPGDFVMMNYIYDYYRNVYLGDTTREMLINHYTCNIPISISNIKRKEYFKEKIKTVAGQSKKAKVLSVGSGPARELIELLKEDEIKTSLNFHCLDFERKAFEHIKSELIKIDTGKTSCCKIEYIQKDYIKDLARKKDLKGLSKDYDFIYCSGVFDYLKDRIATSLVDTLFDLLRRGGVLIFCNANNKNSFYRVAYEMMGDWVFNHREKDQLVKWLKNIKDKAEFRFEDLSEKTNYLFLNIKKV